MIKIGDYVTYESTHIVIDDANDAGIETTFELCRVESFDVFKFRVTLARLDFDKELTTRDNTVRASFLSDSSLIITGNLDKIRKLIQQMNWFIMALRRTIELSCFVRRVIVSAKLERQ